MSLFNKGDMVRVHDGSWSLAIENNEFRHAFGVELNNRDFEVLHTDLKLPSTDDDQFNTIIIKAKDNGQIVYTQDRMVKPVVPKPVAPEKGECFIYNITIVVENGLDVDKVIEELEEKIVRITYA